MRILIWILLLLALAAAVWNYQARFTAAARAERDRAIGRGEDVRDAEPGVGHVIVGTKSGAAPVDPPAGWTRPTVTTPDVATKDSHSSSVGGSGPVSEIDHVVRHGESLSTICTLHYGTSKSELMSALAHYNKIDRVDSIREGQKLKIPPRSLLLHDK